MSRAGITYLWLDKEFPPFVRLEGKRGDYEVYAPERTCKLKATTVGWSCSACHVVSWQTVIKPKPNYCPNCGAKVRNE